MMAKLTGQVAELRPVGFGRVCFPGSRLGRAFGHDIVTDKDGVTRYCDDLTVLDRNNLRACTFCGLDPNDYDGMDPCIAGLPGIRNACCGHGRDDPYAQTDDGRWLYGDDYLALIEAAGRVAPNFGDDGC